MGIQGVLQISGNNLDGEEFYGRWDHFYFKYIHVPDPKIDALNFGTSVLRDNKVFERSIASNEWEFMKKVMTFYHE